MTMKNPTALVIRALALVFVVSNTGARAESREFTDKQGRKLQGEIIAVSGDQVQIKRSADAKLFALPIKQFVEEDQKAVALFAATNVKHNFEVKYAKTKLGKSKSKSDDVTLEAERWAYKIALRNLSAVDADDVRLDYWLFRRIDDGKIKSAPRVDSTGSLTIASIKKAATYEFTTEPVTLEKTQLDAGYYYLDGTKSKSADSMGGLALRIFRGDKEIFSFGTDKDLLAAAKGEAGKKSSTSQE